MSFWNPIEFGWEYCPINNNKKEFNPRNIFLGLIGWNIVVSFEELMGNQLDSLIIANGELLIITKAFGRQMQKERKVGAFGLGFQSLIPYIWSGGRTWKEFPTKSLGLSIHRESEFC